ncbi:MAG: hypothetical protein ABT01_01580 [Clostridium sp. SCN 57-10]|nr:MAG: hypothetical protein ABT01_01580 [Clostridium sp. SCN 57-10]
MTQVYGSAAELIGATPLLRLKRLEQAHGCRAALYGKLESYNPGGSLKDRAALFMLRDALSRGVLTEGMTVVEGSGGNAGVSMAMACAALGLKCVIVLPDNTPHERRALIAAFGARIEETPAAQGLARCAERARELCSASPCFQPCQFENDAACEAHRRTTAREILDALPGGIDCFVAGVGTGASLTGCGEVLKMHFPDCRVIAVEPVDSPVLSGGFPGGHVLQGIGAGFVPPILNTYIIDEVIRARTPDSFAMARECAAREGVLCGISSGAALSAAVSVAQRYENTGKTVVVLLPDSGERYLSAGLYG